jgi:hypothetical protein
MVDFMTQVGRLARPMTTREQIYGFFKKKYPAAKWKGEAKWKSELTRALQPFTKGKNGQPQTYQSVRRRFEGNRLNSKLTPKTEAEYKALGKKLPPVRPERGYHVRGTVCISVGGYPCEERKWNHKVIATVADYIHQTGSLQALVNVYFGDLPEEEEPQAELCDDEDECKSKVKVTALSEKGARTLPNIDGSK